MNPIYRHQSGGTLWQGNLHDVLRLLEEPHPEIKVIGLFAQEFQPDDPTGHYELLKVGYDDNPMANDVELSSVANLADSASDDVADRLRDGKSVLSSCAAGVNRSGLVSALTLMKLTGMGPDQAIAQVRSKRAPQRGMLALSNPRFVEIVRKLHSVSGLKEAWTIWRK